MKKYKWLALILVLPLLLSSCADIFNFGLLSGTSSGGQFGGYFEGITPVRGEILMSTADLSGLDLEYSERSMNAVYDSIHATRIVFSDGGTTVQGKGAEAIGSDALISAAGTYIISGSAKNARLTVRAGAEDFVQLVLFDLSLDGKEGTAIALESASEVLITVEGANSLSAPLADKPSALDKETSAVLLSNVALTINGNGSLFVKARRVHGIVSRGMITITGGDLNISSTGAGLIGESCVRIGGGKLTIVAEEEGILSGAVLADSDPSVHEAQTVGYVYISGGMLEVTSEGDAVHTESILLIKNGTITLTTGVSLDDVKKETADAPETLPDFWEIFESEEENELPEFSMYSDGIYAASDVLIYGGTLMITASNHAIFSEKSICADGGRIYAKTLGDSICAKDAVGISDGVLILPQCQAGIVSDDLWISGGHIYVGEAQTGVRTLGILRMSGGVLAVAGAKELPLTFEAAITTGGHLIALGNGKIAREFFPSNAQGVIFCHFNNRRDGYPLSLCDSDGSVILSLVGEVDYSCAYLSAPGIVRGNTYALSSGGYAPNSDKYGFAADSEAPIASEPLALVTANS